jgi:hypothetical protein
VVLPATEIAIPREVDPNRRLGHGEGFGKAKPPPFGAAGLGVEASR